MANAAICEATGHMLALDDGAGVVPHGLRHHDDGEVVGSASRSDDVPGNNVDIMSIS